MVYGLMTEKGYEQRSKTILPTVILTFMKNLTLKNSDIGGKPTSQCKRVNKTHYAL